MGRVLLALVSTLFLVTQVMAGAWTSNNFLYKPASGARGDDERAKFDSGLNRVDSRLANEKWLNDSQYSGDLATAITAIGSVQTVLSIPAGNWPIAANLTIPANLTLKVARGALLTIATTKTLTINGTLDAGLYQIFSCTGTGAVVLGSKVKECYPEWFGAVGDDATDDGPAITLACNSLSNIGCKTLVFTNKSYRTYKVGTTYINLGTFTGITGLSLISRGATLAIDPARTFANGTGLTNHMFLFTNCHNILVDGFNVTGPALTSTQMGNKASPNFVWLQQGCSNVSMPYNRLQGVCSAVTAAKNSGDPESYRSKGINLGVLEINNCSYGVVCAFSGDDLRVNLLRASGHYRSFFTYGTRNQTVNIRSTDCMGGDVLIVSYTGGGVRDLDLTYINTDSGAAASEIGYRMTLEWMDQTPATFRNIRIKKIDNLGADDTVDRGHVLDNFEFSGVLEGVPTAPGGGIITTNPGCSWGLSGTPDVWRNIKFSDLIIPGINTVLIATAAITDRLILENITSTLTPWAIRKNFPDVVPAKNAGPVVVRSCNIKNQWAVTDTWYDAIMRLPLATYATANAYTLSARESGKIVDNAGVGATQTVTLPAAVVGLEYHFICTTDQDIRIVPASGEYIVGASAANKYFELTSRGASAHLFCNFGGYWQVRSSFGTTGFE
jgi:hypothetical protein